MFVQRYPDPISAIATSYDSVTPARKPPTKRVHACTVTRNASCESTYSSKRQILADTSAIQKDQNMIMNAGSSAMPGPFEPPVQPECCPTPFVTPFDSSDGMLKLKLLAVVAENKALNEERENLLQKYSDTQQQFLQLKKLQEGCFGCHKLKEKDYKYYTGLQRNSLMQCTYF